MAPFRPIFGKNFGYFYITLQVQLFHLNFNWSCHSAPAVWPDVEVKSSPNTSKRCPKSNQSCFYFNIMFFQTTQKLTKYLGYFCRQIFHRELKKSHNLVTLRTIHLFSPFKIQIHHSDWTRFETIVRHAPLYPYHLLFAKSKAR